MAAAPRPPPVTTTRLKQIAQDACDSTLTNATSYVHSSTESWNATIINKILTSLLASAQTSTGTTAQYKYAVNSTIIQHLASSSSLSSSPSAQPATASTGTSTNAETNGQTVSPPSTPPPAEAAADNTGGGGGGGGASAAPGSVAPEKGRRGMHSATGAYWNSETDGMFSYKYEGGEVKGMDVVVSVIWVAV